MEKLFQLLESDHERITELLSEILTETDADLLDDLFEQFLEELERHMEREEEHLYPDLEKNEATMTLVQEAYEEHDRARQLVDDLSELPPGNSRWRTLLQELNEQVGHHIHFEEHRIFPRLHSLFTPERLDEVFLRMTARKS